MALFVTPTSYQQRRIDFFDIVTPTDLLRAVVAESPNQNLPISGKDTFGVYKRNVVSFLKFNCGGVRYNPSAVTRHVTRKREWLSVPLDRSHGCPGERRCVVPIPSPLDQIFSLKTILNQSVSALQRGRDSKLSLSSSFVWGENAEDRGLGGAVPYAHPKNASHEGDPHHQIPA